MNSTPSITQQIRDDHKKAIGLFTQALATEVRATEMHGPVARELLAELEIHARLEEELFYPALEERLPLQSKTYVTGARAAHEDARALIERLKALDTESDHFLAGIEELRGLILQHMQEEERLLLPEADKALGQQLGELGERYRSRREDLLNSAEFAPARPEEAQDPNGGEQMRKSVA
jgi:hypothetical protein